mmetsp:Transcript_114096/g.362730  ORF Transcript_114096/g.362730 Transcript_114096/m.362730 type:complete len:224 (-) Transcript_114096:1023-1694(-)
MGLLDMPPGDRLRVGVVDLLEVARAEAWNAELPRMVVCHLARCRATASLLVPVLDACHGDRQFCALCLGGRRDHELAPTSNTRGVRMDGISGPHVYLRWPYLCHTRWKATLARIRFRVVDSTVCILHLGLYANHGLHPIRRLETISSGDAGVPAGLRICGSEALDLGVEQDKMRRPKLCVCGHNFHHDHRGGSLAPLGFGGSGPLPWPRRQPARYLGCLIRFL